MKKYFLFLLNLGVMVLAFVFASCSGGSSSKLTNEGIFGEMPGYLLQYLDLKQKCVEELEFEDNKDKRNEIITKYIEEWNKILPSQKVQELREKPVSDSVPIISHRRVSFSKGLAGITDMEASMVGKYKVNLEVLAKAENPSYYNELCFMLDKNDSVIFPARVFFKNGRASIAYSICGDDRNGVKMFDGYRCALYALDKISKIVVPTDEELLSYVEKAKSNLGKIAKELLEDGIIENVEELTGIKQEENKEDAEQADMNKPGDVDLAYFELRGKVKSFTERNDDNSISYSFTEKGKWNTYNGRSIQNALSDVERDAQKRIIKYTEGEYDCIDSEEITYDSKTGWVSKIKHNGEGEDITTFTYDEKGYLIKKVCEGESWEMGAEEGEKFKDTTTYTYESFDEYGNWTARSAKSSDGRSWKETRRIKYYE